MEFETKELYFNSSNKENRVYAKIIEPKNVTIKGIVQICHGMCEYFDKYNHFSEFLASNGYIVCGHDHIGHGNSVSSSEERGYFAPKDGYKYLIEDTHQLTTIVEEKIGKNDLPLILLGHSMGSFIARCYAAKYGEMLNGLILCGSIGPQPFVNAGIRLAKTMAKSKGDHYRSKKLYDLSLDFANIKFLPAETKFDWICSDENEVKKHIQDEKSNFIFTVSGFEDLFHLVSLCNSRMVIKTIPKELPIFFMSGEMDPIGENGTGVRKAVQMYLNAGIKNLSFKLYPHDRHELLNETNKKEVYNNILMTLYGYSPTKIYSIENILLTDAIKEDDSEKIVKLSNLMLQGALISSNYTDALTLLHNILTRIPNPKLVVNGAINTRFLLLSLVNIEILFSIGDFRNCIEVAEEILNVLKPDIIDKIKPVSFSINLFVSHLMETFRLAALAKLLTMDSDLDAFFDKIKSSLNSEMPERDAIFAIKDYLAGKKYVPSNIEESTPFAKIIYLFLQEIETNRKRNNNKVFAQNIYQAKLLSSDIHQSQLQFFAELLIADAYAKEGATHKAAVIINDIAQKSESSAIYNIVLLSKYFMARLEMYKSNNDEAIKLVNDALALLQQNNNQAKVFYALFEKFFIELAKAQNNSTIDIKSEEKNLEIISPNGELSGIID